MAHYRLRQSYGHGAAKLTLAPAFTPSPYARPATLAADMEQLSRELREAGPARLAARTLAIGGGSIAVVFALSLLLAPLFAPPPDDGDVQIMVIATPRIEPEEELVPEPPPVLPEPEPVQVAQEPEPEPVAPEPEPIPEPVKIVKKAQPPRPLPAMPAPIEPPPKEFVPTPAPVRVAREPVKRPPTVVSIDPLSPVPLVPSDMPAPLPLAKRTAARAPAANRPALPALADFAPIGEPAPSGAPAALASRAVRTNVVARPGAATRTLAFAAAAPAAPPAAFDEEGSVPALATRSNAPRARAATTSSASRPNSLGFNAAAPGATVADTSASSAGRAERAALKRAAGTQNDNLAAVPLGSLASCATDREEDQRKLAVLSAVRGRTECRSSAGRYRFVETKNLNAFLMWIERAPNRVAVDRCVELRLALECLGG